MSAAQARVGAPGRIGPNAITQLASALLAMPQPGQCASVFRSAGLEHHLLRPPTSMVDEEDAAALHRAVHRCLQPALADEVSRAAGHRTAQYLIAHRIPRPMAWCLKRMPARLASAVLLQAIARHAWTFAGSGRFVASGRHPVRVALFDCPLCRGAASEAPRCSYYLACFQHLFRTLVHPRARVNLRGCAAAGADACRFDIDW